ncbi:hypothetical protein D3C77_325500 [compost metagenome]
MSGVKKRLIFSLLTVCLIGSTTLWYSTTSKQDALTMQQAQSESVQTVSYEPTASAENVEQPSVEVLSQRMNEYHINVMLDEKTGTLIGTQTVTFKHPGKKTINELYLHLYPNAFSSKDSTFMKESGGKLRGDVMPKNGYGNMTLTEVTTTDGISLLHRVRYV